jgi:hypothetical protein
VPSAPFFEPDPLEWVSGPSLAGKGPKKQNLNYRVFEIDCSFVLSGRMARRPPCRGTGDSRTPARPVSVYLPRPTVTSNTMGFNMVLLLKR